MIDGHIGEVMHGCIARHDAPMHQLVQVLSDNSPMHEVTRDIIRMLMAEQGIASERQLAIDCGMSQSTLNRFLKGETDTLDFNHLQALAQYFSLTVSQLIGETPFEADPKIRVVTVAMQQMPEYKKDVLVAASSSLTQPDKSDGTDGR